MLGVFFTHNLETGFGGMESHQRAFVSYYFKRETTSVCQFKYIVDNSESEVRLLSYDYENGWLDTCKDLKDIREIGEWLLSMHKDVPFLFFFNDVWWIEGISILRNMFPQSLMFLRSGGNDIEKAPICSESHDYKQRRSIYRTNLNLLDKVISNSDFTTDRLIRLGITQDRVVKVRGGVDGHIAAEMRQCRQELRQQLLDDMTLTCRYIVMYASRFVPFKGISSSLVALSKSSIYHDTHVLLVGDGPERTALEALCSTVLQKGSYTFTGALDTHDVLRLMASSDLVINSSLETVSKAGNSFYIHTETMGRTMMESICVGTHVLASNVGGIPELFDENDYIGYMVPIEFMTEAFSDIDSIISTPVSLNCDYGWDAVFARYEALFTDDRGSI